MLFWIFLTYFDNLLFFSKPFNWSNVKISVLINKSYFSFTCKSFLVQSNLHNFRLKRKKKISDFYLGDSYHRKHVIFKQMNALLKTRHKTLEKLGCEDMLCVSSLLNEALYKLNFMQIKIKLQQRRVSSLGTNYKTTEIHMAVSKQKLPKRLIFIPLFKDAAPFCFFCIPEGWRKEKRSSGNNFWNRNSFPLMFFSSVLTTGRH